MKLYSINGRAWAGTQADAKAAAQGGTWYGLDVPTDKPGLIAWLNDRKVPGRLDEGIIVFGGEANAAIAPAPNDPPTVGTYPPNDRCPGCSRTPTAAAKIAAAGDVDTIADWILEALVERQQARLDMRRWIEGFR